jgi:hypothetical protein
MSYDPPCPHGYSQSSCAECRHISAAGEHTTIVSPVSAPSTVAEITQRQAQITAELQRMDADPVAREDTHGELRDRLIAELDALRTERRVLARSEAIEGVRRAAMDPANLEGPEDGSRPFAAPAVVKGKLGTRIESPQETIQRANPWRDPDRGPLTHETSQGYVSRAHVALETLSERLTHDGAELLASLLSERRDTRGVSVRRSADEVREGAEMILGLSSPFYESAMRHVFRNPDLFRTGMGAMVWSDEERQAVHGVMNNYLVRAAFAETSGAAGAFALPLQLDPTIMFTNAGIASPHRNLARHELGTSNTWNGG